MIPFQALSRVLAVQPVLDAVERDQAAPRAAFEHLRIGQTLTGLVKNQAKGLSVVDIEGQAVVMRLPRQVASGDTLRLRFAGHLPQPVFLLETPETAADEAPQLSHTARMLSEIMQRVPERTLPTLTPPTPLLGRPTAHPAELALALRTALVRSGLFYESHLADWVAGQDSLEGLMQEPQNRFAAEAARLQTAPNRMDAEAAQTLATAALEDGQGSAGTRAAHPLHALLTQQLQVLEAPHFAWRGELWPGQPIEWQLRRDAEQADAGPSAPATEEAPAGWESRLKLTLPRLGTLDVHIRLDPHQAFSIRMMPAQPETAPLLQQHQSQLSERLAAAGCVLNTLTVQHDGGA